ncbi:putative N-acetyltransferase [Escovopsis weberi]|uniref:N-alpha-acetyltransferase 40 n=1 Tax=Escovopsis weberi TaxID=150374 RepID=A0A0M8MVS6_ESCWE|nr:putative N-acetyltransferase [Escovopsis weberi]
MGEAEPEKRKLGHPGNTGPAAVEDPTPSNPLEAAIRASDEAFIQRYLKPDGSTWPVWTQGPDCCRRCSLSLVSAGDLTPDEHAACFDMVRLTSEADYRGSSLGWHPRAKRREMREPELRYVLVRDGEGALQGFMSMMPTVENGEAVVYCYEIHLMPVLQGTGLGRLLMGFGMAVAENIPVRKMMLTCFRSNKRALRFYERLGFEVDDFSPRERRLRSGRVVESDYRRFITHN